MARLNEVPAPAGESVEALKRRFIRQNREIARVNSNQSIRIRNLETEISRLLAENIAIREDAINARTEAEKWRASHRLNKEVVRMKEHLELKLSEVSALVGELGALPEKVARRSSQRRKNGGLVSDLIKSIDDKEPRHRQTMLEQEGRLPAILEDKHYPRRTLESKDVQALANEENAEATESPDLGPPPIAHFDHSEAVTFDPARSPRRTSTELIQEIEAVNKQSSMHVENRRKRRNSALLQPVATDTTEVYASEEAELTIPEPEKQDAPVLPRPVLKIGAKRKLEASELEDTSRVSKELDDFIFQRKTTNTPVIAARQSRFSRPPGRQSQEDTNSAGNPSSERSVQSSRKILAPKSTNSPAKRSLVASHGKSDEATDGVSEKKPDRRVISRIRTKPASIDIPEVKDAISDHEKATHSADDQARLAPKTPAIDIDDVLSPVSTEQSTKQRLPKEMAVTNSVEDVLNGSIGRGTRRARAPVNYAQPNLRDKMRRPGKELVGAVEGLIKLQTDTETDRINARSNSVGIESAKQDRKIVNASSKDEQGLTEGKEQVRWRDLERGHEEKSEPASPLRGKVAPSSRSDEPERDITGDELSRAVFRLSVFDVHDSSPETRDVNRSLNDKQNVSTVRRHSTISRPTEDSETKSGRSILKSRRPNSALGFGPSQQPEEPDGDQRRGHVRKAASVTSIPPADQLTRRAGMTSKDVVPSGGVQPETLEPRTRSSALTRRKSMMV